MLNKRNDFLVVLVATYNRLNPLKRTLDSIASGTRCPHEVIVIDGGSTDGTIEYLQSNPSVTPVFQGRLLGHTRAFNEVWRQVESKYTCWLCADTELVEGSLDLAIEILESNPEIGMVALKMKDTMGGSKIHAYAGGIGKLGVLNPQAGVLPTKLLRAVGYFNESYYHYTTGVDLATSILCAGKTVVTTKHVSVLHHVLWDVPENYEEVVKERHEGIDHWAIYLEKFKCLQPTMTRWYRIKKRLGYYLGRLLFLGAGPHSVRLGLNRRDLQNITGGRWIRLLDPLYNIRNPYHLVQKIPTKTLRSLEGNPYQQLVTSSIHPEEAVPEAAQSP